MTASIPIHVNGKLYDITADPETPLLYLLRNDLGLKGAKYACGLGQCGACVVILNGETAPACSVPIGAIPGAQITTLEGLGTPEDLHPLQRAFILTQAVQCGYCVGGMIVGAKALLDQKPSPTEAEIRKALAIHLCRCGVHNRVVEAIQIAAEEMSR